MPPPEELRFRAGEITLAGTLVLPEADQAARLPWVLLLPSWLPRDRDGAWDRQRHAAWFAPPDGSTGLLARLADALAARGVASLRYDPRGCGESDGAWESSDLFTRIDDGRDAIGAMRSRRELDLRRTAIVGHGEATVIALSVSIGDPAVGAIGLIGPYARSMRDTLRRGVANRSRTGVDRQHPVVRSLDRLSEELIERAERHEPSMSLPIAGEATTLSLAAWEQAFHTPPLALATMLHRNVVIAYGTEDAWTDADDALLLEDALREAGNDPVLQRVPGAGHDLVDPPTAVDSFADALVARMEPRELPPVLVAIEQMSSPTLDSAT